MRSQVYYYLCLFAISYAPASSSASSLPVIAVADLQRQLSNQTTLQEGHHAHHGHHAANRTSRLRHSHHRHHHHGSNHTVSIQFSSDRAPVNRTVVARVARPFGIAPVVAERNLDERDVEEGDCEDGEEWVAGTSTPSASAPRTSTSTRTITETAVVPLTRTTTRRVTQVTGTSTRVLTFTQTVTRTATTTAKPSSSQASSTSKASSTTKTSSAPTSSNTSGQLRTLYKGKTSGDATWYGDNGYGNCMLPRPDFRFAAWPGATYGKGTYCGACVKVTGSAGTEVVQITDQCPECLEGSLDLSTSMFKKIVGPESIGRAKVSWEFVDCVDAGLESGRLSYYWKAGSSQWWAGIQVRGGGPPVNFIEVRTAGSSDWVKPARTDYNYFVSPNGFGVGPFTIRTTFQDGSTATDTNVPMNGNIED